MSERRNDELLTPAEVAEWLHVEVGTLATWRSSDRRSNTKKGPAWQPICSRIFYRRSDVQNWLDVQRSRVA